MIAYYFRNSEGSLLKIVDEDDTSQAYRDINDIIIELTEKHITPVLAVIQGGKKWQHPMLLRHS